MREFFRPSTEQLFRLASDPDKLLAYNLLIYYLNCEYNYFPNYNHTRFNDLKKVENQSAFKYMLKFVKDKKSVFESVSEYFIFIKAQLEIAKILESKNPLIHPAILIGDKADKRYFVWKQKVANKKMVTKIGTKILDEKTINLAFDKTLEYLKSTLLNEMTFTNFNRNISRILLLIRCKQIDPLWCFCSKWISKLPEELKNEIYSITECKKYKDFNTEDINKKYLEKFSFELREIDD